MKNPCPENALRELEAAGIRNVERAVGGKHLQLRWQVIGGPLRMYVLPLTPGDHRAVPNTRAGIRRRLREDGVLVEHVKPAPAESEPKSGLTVQRLADIERRLAEIEPYLSILETPRPRRWRKKSKSEGSEQIVLLLAGEEG